MAIVVDKAYSPATYGYDYRNVDAIMTDFETMWDFKSRTIESDRTIQTVWLNDAKTIGIRVTWNASAIGTKIYISFNGSTYNEITNSRYGCVNIKYERFPEALIMSIKITPDNLTPLAEVSANDCAKIIITKALNTLTQEEDYIICYLGSYSSNNVFSMYAPDMPSTPVNQTAQNASANTNAKTTNLIPLWSTRSAFVTTNIYQSLCENISSWYFGYVFVNGIQYRMSGSIFVVDE